MAFFVIFNPLYSLQPTLLTSTHLNPLRPLLLTHAIHVSGSPDLCCFKVVSRTKSQNGALGASATMQFM